MGKRSNVLLRNIFVVNKNKYLFAKEKQTQTIMKKHASHELAKLTQNNNNNNNNNNNSFIHVSMYSN